MVMSNKLTFIQRKVVELFAIDPTSKTGRGWIVGAECPYCHSKSKFGIKLNDVSASQYKNHISFNCFRGSCQEKGSEYKLLNHIGKGDLLNHGEFIGATEKVINQLNDMSDELQLEVPKVSYPFGFKRVTDNAYLQGRGVKQWQFDTYVIGKTKLYTPLKNYVLISITENGIHKGYVGRLEMTESQRVAEERRLQINNPEYYLPKYKNEGDVEFSKLLAGIDQITPQVNTAILVEGITDKFNVDNLLKSINLYETTQCLCTFGKKISEEQIAKMAIKGIDSAILLYDPDAINESKHYSYQMKLWDIDVKVGYLSHKDPGELNQEELTQILQNVQSPDQFSISKVNKNKLQ